MPGGVLRNVEAFGRGRIRRRQPGRVVHRAGAALLRRWSRRGFSRRKTLSPGRICADTVRDAASRSARSPDQLPALRRRRRGRAAQRGLAPGPDRPGRLLVSSLLLLVILALLLVRRGHAAADLRRRGGPLHVLGGAPHAGRRAAWGAGSGVLLFMPVVGIALYGKRWESVVCVAFILAAIGGGRVASSSAVDAAAARCAG